MKWQLLLLSLATVIAGYVGAARWRARITAAGDLQKTEAAGNWYFAVAADSGLKVWSRATGAKRIPHYERVGLFDGFDATPDLRRVVAFDNATYGEPTVKILEATRPDRPIATAKGRKDHQVQCPVFEPGGDAALFFETQPYAYNPNPNAPYSRPLTDLRRFETKDGPDAPVSTVDLPVVAVTDHCFELSRAGDVIAWVGTDLQTHVGRYAPDGVTAAKAFSTNDFALSPDGTWLATVDGSHLNKLDIASGKKTAVAETSGRTVAVSPDGEWIAVQQYGGFGNEGYTAYRISDGSPVSLAIPARVGYGYDPRQASRWFVRSGDPLPDVTPTPRPTPRGPRHK